MSTEPTEPAAEQSPVKAIIITLVVVLAVIIVPVLIFRASGAPQMGEPCTDLCETGHTCVEEVCTRPCEADADCPSGWSCGTVRITTSAVGIDLNAGSVSMCVK